MTAPQAEGADRISEVEKSPLDARAAAFGIAILLLVGLLLRLTIAYVLLPGSGFESDIGTFTAWAFQLGQRGPADFYATAGFADYPPGYLYVLWLIGGIGNTLAPMANGDAASAIASLIKIPPMLADLAIGYLLYHLVLSWRRPHLDAQRLALLAAAIYVFNPVTWYDSAIWGQTDAVGSLVLLLTVAALVRGNSEGASALAVVALLVKPQFGVVALPLVGIVLLRRHLLQGAQMPRHRVLLPEPLHGWFEDERGAWRLVSSAVVAFAVLFVLILPFSLDLPGIVRQVAKAAGGYEYLSVNAYNAWSLVGADGATPLAFGGGWSSDSVALLGPLPGVVIGGALLAIGFLAGVVRLAWLDDRRSIVVATIFLALAFFVLPTRVHERYMFPIFALLPILAVVDRRWLAATVVLSIAAFINMHGVLTTPLYATPNLENLALGDWFREPVFIVIAVVLHIGGFAFIAWRMTPRAASEPDPYAKEPDLTFDTPDPDRQTGAHPIDAGEGAWWEPLSALVPRFSVRRDRSALLAGEPAGRIGRLDLALLAVVFLAALGLRTYRLEQPFSMHFDEVYHARTAMEFLQDWRYGMPHSIYEFTHPHLAKYAIALGIEALGNNRVVSTTDLGAPVTAAAIEARWSPPDAPNEYDGDRLYVATGSDVRVYDLAQPGPALVATIGGSWSTVAVDATDHILFLGAADGSLGQLPTDGLDELRSGLRQPSSDPLDAAPFGSVPDLSGDLDRLAWIGESLIGASTGGTLVSLDPYTGEETGRSEIPGVADMVQTAAPAEVVVDPGQVEDLATLSDTLAGLLEVDATQIEALIAGADRPVAVAGYAGAQREDIQTEIDAGNLPGVTIDDGTGVALATPTGVTLLDSVTLNQLGEVSSDVPVTGLDFATQGPEQPTLYAAAGSLLLRIQLPSDADVAQAESVPMPNTVDKVYWDPSTTMVHVLGTAQDGSSATVYVVEPRGNSVFADAPLEFDPQSIVIDAQPERPANDRADLLAFSAGGQLATVDIGNNQFAYRFPGVLAGALTAMLMFLLARFLFRRRSVAMIVALLVLADGMFFANARIAMNDTYVTFFIVAAMTVFVPLWLGRWRSGWATAGGLAAVGILLGLALASKWVGAYAIGGVGLLILLRSALGRWVALAAMIMLTAVLGYIAITPASGVENPQLNYPFLLLMIGLTVLLAVAMVVRPVRLTREELRLAVGLPALAGIVGVLYGGYRLIAGPPAAEGALLPPARIVILGVVALASGLAIGAVAWYLGKRGQGPLGSAATVDPEAEPASPPPPRGWLRPGSGLLGLPWLLALAAVVVLPIVVYVLSYIPWINLGNQWFQGFPAGHTGQTLLDLQRSMYDYHNYLRATHPASSPWWAWPLDLKPVWFEQNDYANGTTAVIYDTGNLVAFWLAIPAVAFAAWKAWRRRSLALTMIVISIAAMWLPWARIDRATFQYHIFTTLPFSFLALAYFLAELWHGPSERTWVLARVAAALAIIGAPLLWLLRLPLCAIANTQQVNSGTEVCAALSRDLTLTDLQVLGLLLALGGLVAAGLLVYAVMQRERDGSLPAGRAQPLLLPVSFSVALLGVVIVVIGAGLPGNAVFAARVTAEEPALIALLLLSVPAYFALRASDPRRFVVGVLMAVVAWFVAFYPNIASLPVPQALSQIHLGLLPTWNWGFQFGVNLDEPNRSPLDFGAVSLLAVAVIGLCLAAVYFVRNWQTMRGGSDEISQPHETS